MPWNGPMTPGDLLARFHTEVRLADRDAAPGFVVDRDGPVHRTYPPNPTEHGAMVECPEGLGDDPVHDVALPGGVRLRDIETDDDWDRVRVMADLVWGTDSSWVNDSLRVEQRARPDLMTATVVEDSASGAVLSYAVLRLTEGSSFCGLWGGSTLPEWRRRGPYRALVRHPAPAAVERGVPYARVDTTAASRPILVALGMHAVCATRPWILEPAVTP